jgi:hypothetical protein
LLFFFLYGPVEDALPVYVATDLHARAPLLGAYWTAFGMGALVASLVTARRPPATCDGPRSESLLGWGRVLC